MAEILIFSVIISQALLLSTSVSKSSKAVNLFETPTQFCYLPSISFNSWDPTSLYEICVIFIYALLVSP
jgi:hypothetical protein